MAAGCLPPTRPGLPRPNPLAGVGADLGSKPRIMSGSLRRFVEKKAVGGPKTAEMSGFCIRSLKRLLWFHSGTRRRRNEFRGVEFGVEDKDSGAVTIILNSCDSIPGLSSGRQSR